MKLLDLFCCEGGAAAGYARAGFAVTGVDIAPCPRYPFTFVQADALEYFDSLTWLELAQYDVLHASPPCQRWADGVKNPDDWPDFITPIRERFADSGLPYVIENVRRAPLLNRVMICGGGLGIVHGDWQLHRHRYFESNLALMGVSCARQARRTASVVGHGTPSGMRREGLPDLLIADRRALMEMPWASREGTSEAIPPRYTEFIGEQILSLLPSTPLEG